jgi:hypothetical protein
MALWLDLTSAAEKGTANLDPALRRLERILKVFARAKDENEQAVLMAPRERKRIAAPTTAPEPQATGNAKEKDDDIPF